jgi:ATP-dependent helicase HrpB
MTSALPIDEVLSAITGKLRDATRLVVTAPPGAGKTTRIPLVLMAEPWAETGRILLVEPRRIAARAAAERMAAMLGETVGRRIGLRARTDVRTSREARIEVVTEGVFTRMILSDPSLDGVCCILFDEFHERSLDGDEGLALAQNAQELLREDLRLVVMSATPPPDLTRAVFDADTVASDGRAFPVETIYLGSDPNRRIEDQAAAAVQRALREQPGSLLVFLPGAAEIQRTADRLEALPSGTTVRPLFGALSIAEQSAAIAPTPPGERKIVLATDIAESSLTIEGVRVVIDAGLARVPRYDERLGVARLETVRVSVASADQRRGRAGRTQPGACYRLWREAEMQGFELAPAPEIETADLTGLRLDLARWGVSDPGELRWLTPPRASAWARATDHLRGQSALDEGGALTPLGLRLSNMPLPPRLGGMLLKAATTGNAALAAEIAALLSERELGGRSTDLEDRLQRFRSDSGQRGRAMRDLSRKWAREAAGDTRGHTGGETGGDADASEILAAAFPERIARARPEAPGRFLMAGGRGARVEETDPLAREPWIVIADVVGGGADLRITLAARLDPGFLERQGLIQLEETARFDVSARAVRGRLIRRVGAILLQEQPVPAPRGPVVADALTAALRHDGFALLAGHEALSRLLDRIAFLADTIGSPWPAGFQQRLLDDLPDWLGTRLEAPDALDRLTGPDLAAAALTLLDWSLSKELDRLAPRTWRSPAGRDIEIDYGASGGPTVSCRVQEAYGLRSHPAVGAAVPLTLSLLSPASRPVATTRNIVRFWSGGYADMRKDMRGRYPKHDWPDDPANADPSAGPRRRK